MGNPCSRHPDRTSDSVCKHCGGAICSLCRVDVDGSLFCSSTCFTELSLSTKRRTLREAPVPPVVQPAEEETATVVPASDPPPPAPPSVGAAKAGTADPLASIDFGTEAASPAATSPSDPSVILGADQAQVSQDDSSVLMSAAAGGENGSDTSILDLRALKKLKDGTYGFESGSAKGPRKGAEESSVQEISALNKDHTTLLGLHPISTPKKEKGEMPVVFLVPEPPAVGRSPERQAQPKNGRPILAWFSDRTPASAPELSPPLAAPEAQASTFPTTCVFHPDTPAELLCSKCGDPICTRCV